MDTLQVNSDSQTGGISKTSSRTPSPCRSDQMSKDRETTDTTNSGGGGGSAVRFRNQSPSTHRRSRDRERTTAAAAAETSAASKTLLANNSIDANNMTAVESSLADYIEHFDDSRLSDEMGYQSFTSEEIDIGGVGSTIALVQGDGQIVGGGHHGSSSSGRHHHRTNSGQALDRLNTKLACTRESIRKEQTARDDNVNEYLKLAASADKQQLQRIKAVFEKKNQKSAHGISQLQKKLEQYNKRVKDLQIHQNQKLQNQSHRQPREVLRDVSQGLRNVGGNIRDGISGLSGSVMSKPREFAHLIKNKFGSADNINQLSTWYTDPELNAMNLNNSQHLIDLQSQHGGTSTPNNTTVTAGGSAGVGGGGNTGTMGSGKFNSEHGSECSSVTSDSIPGGSGKNHAPAEQYLKTIIAEIQERREDCDKLRERLERLEACQKDVADLERVLESERYRAERLEEQINDLTELHQNEIENLKQAMADMEEKVQYQSDERLRDVNEVLENCQTRITKMEHMSQQQYVTVEGIDNSNARALVVKLINVVLTVLQVVLLLVATAAGIIMPFLKTRVRVLTTLFFIFMTIFIIRQWPDVRDIGSHMVRHLKESLVVK